MKLIKPNYISDCINYLYLAKYQNEVIMYQINKIQNKITKLKECTFSELKFKERELLKDRYEV